LTTRLFDKTLLPPVVKNDDDQGANPKDAYKNDFGFHKEKRAEVPSTVTDNCVVMKGNCSQSGMFGCFPRQRGYFGRRKIPHTILY
jgi:hypothetical protein